MTNGASAVQLAIELRVEMGGWTDERYGAVTTQVIAGLVDLHATATGLMAGPHPCDLVPRHPTATFFRRLACLPIPLPPTTG